MVFKNSPVLYTLEEIVEAGTNPEVLSEHSTGEWVPARRLGLYTLRRRLTLAWMVFSGQADVVKWPGDQ